MLSKVRSSTIFVFLLWLDLRLNPSLPVHIYVVPSISFQTFLQAFEIVVDSWNYSMLLLYIWWDGLTIFFNFTFKWTGGAWIGIHPTKALLSQLEDFKNTIWSLEEWYARKFCFKLGKNAKRWKLDLLLWPRDQEFPMEACWLSQILEGQTKFWWSLFWWHWHDLHALVPTGQTVNKEYYVEVLWKFRKRFRRKRPEFFKSGQRHFLQDNAPVYNSILVTDYLTKMGIKTVPHLGYSPVLVPVTFGYSLSSEAVVMRQLRRWKRLWRRSLTRSHKKTSMGPCWNGTTSALKLEEINSKGTRVSWV